MRTNAELRPVVRIDEPLEECLHRLEIIAEQSAQRRRELDAWLKTQPQTLVCSTHTYHRPLNGDESSRKSYGQPNFSVVYDPCPLCIEADARRHRNEHWLARGIPPKLLGRSLDDLVYDTPECRGNLEVCRQYAEQPNGFLVLSGSYGTGKSHIGCAILQKYGKGLFVTQSSLLAQHRATYSDDHVPEVKRTAMFTPLLVLDEIGVSVGGRDEGPLLYDIIDHRYSEKLPTILISNLEYKALLTFLGGRIVDRLRESVFAVLHFHEPSKRERLNDRYLRDVRVPYVD